MTKIVNALAIIAITLLVLSLPDAARAQTYLTWVSGGGADANPCTRAQPCQTLGHAYGLTAASGEIDILDGGAFVGAFSIQKSIKIVNVGAGVASVLSLTVNTASTDEVVLQGLNFNPYSFGTGDAGVDVTGAGSLIVDHCAFHNYTNAAIYVTPSAAAKLHVVDTLISNGGGGSFGAVELAPQTGASLMALLERVQIINSPGNGIRADSEGFAGAGPVTVQLHDVTVDGSNGGSAIVAVSSTSGGAKATIIADNVTSVNNAGYGFRAVGGTASIVLRRSMIGSNAIGVGVLSGGQVFSYGDNSFTNNSSGNGVTPTAIPLE